MFIKLNVEVQTKVHCIPVHANYFPQSKKEIKFFLLHKWD